MKEDRSVQEGDLVEVVKRLGLWSLDPVVRDSVSLMDKIRADDLRSGKAAQRK